MGICCRRGGAIPVGSGVTRIPVALIATSSREYLLLPRSLGGDLRLNYGNPFEINR